MKEFSILKGSFSLLFIIGFSKVVGFFRELLIAGYYGSSYQTDAFFLASSMPGLIFPAICSSLSVVFVSQYTELKVSNNKTDLNDYASNVITVSFFSSLILSIFAILLMPFFIDFLAPGFDSKTKTLAIFMSRCTLATFSITMIRYIFVSIMNVEKKYILANSILCIANFITILSIFLFDYFCGIYSLIIGFILSEVIITFLLLFYLKGKFAFKFYFRITNRLKKLSILIIPVILGNATIQISEIIDRILCSFNEVGAISNLSYSLTIYGIILTTFNTLLSSIFYPLITKLITKNDNRKIYQTLKKTINYGVAILLPLSLFIFFLSENIVTLIFERGAFSSEDTAIVSKILRWYSLGFVFVYVREVFTKTLYGKQQNQRVLYNGLITMFSNIMFSIIFYYFVGIIGIAIGTALSNVISMIDLGLSVKNNLNFKIILEKNFYEKYLIIMLSLLIFLFIGGKYIDISNDIIYLGIMGFGVAIITIILFFLLKLEVR